MTEEKAGTLDGLVNLSSEDFFNTELLDNPSKPEKKEDDEESNKPTDDAEKKVDVESVKKDESAPAEKKDEDPGITAKAKEVAENKSKWATIEAELHKGKTVAEIKKLQEDAKKIDAERYKGKSEEEIIAAKIEDYEDSKPIVTEFKLPEEQKAAAKEGKFTAIAKELGFDITDDTLDTFKEKVEEHYSKKQEEKLSKYAPEAQRFISFLDNGGDITAFIEPNKQFDQYLNLDDVDLITKDLEARKWPADKIEKEITALTENDQLDVSALKIREGLTNAKEKMMLKIIADQEKYSQLNSDYKTKSVEVQLDSVKKSLNTVSEYMETPLTEKHKEYVAKKFADGKYADILKDSEALANFLLYQEFGKDGIANIKTKATQEAKMKYKKDRHNIPPIPGSGVGSKSTQNNTGQQSAGNWNALPVLQE